MMTKTEELYNKFDTWMTISKLGNVNDVERQRLLSAFIMGYTTSLLEDFEKKQKQER